MLFQDNLSALLERFPKVGFSLSLEETSCVAMPHADLRAWAAKLPLAHIELLYVFGWDLSVYQALASWLVADTRRELVFLGDGIENCLAFLHVPGALEALANRQVHFTLLPLTSAERREELRLLANRYPVSRLEIVKSPGLSTRRRHLFYRIRLELLRFTTLSHALHLDRLHSDRLFHHWLANLPRMARSFYANRMQGAFKNVPALICGAGPSLEKSLDLLKNAEQRLLIIAGGSTIAALSAQGITPHFCMALDPNFEEYLRFQNNLLQEVPLLFSTRLFPGVFQTWNGPTGYLRAGIGGVPEIWMEEALGFSDPLIGGSVLSEESISVTSICLAWAQFLGCNPIIFNGIDLAYTERRRYASGVEATEESWKEGGVYSAADRFVVRKDRTGKAVHSAVRWVMEGASFSHFIKQYPEMQFFNATEGGLSVAGVPDLSLEQILQRYCLHEYDLRGRIMGAMAEAAMPENTEEILRQRVMHLRESVERVVAGIQVLLDEIARMKERSQEAKTGRFVLAEMTLREEDAYLLLFYDLFRVFANVMQREWRVAHSVWDRLHAEWTFFKTIADRYVTLFRFFGENGKECEASQ